MESLNELPTPVPSLFVTYWAPVVTCGAAFFMIVLDTSIVNLALARIGVEFNSEISSLQWLVDGYAIVFASLLLGAGALGDRLGVRGTFMAGLVLFTAASAVCGSSPSMLALQIARVVQGIGAAFLLPNSLATLNNTFSDSTLRAKAVASWASAGALGVALGPVLGGMLVQTLGWRSIFIVNVPVGLLAIWMTYRYLPKSNRHPNRSLDPLGQVFAMAALAVAGYTLINVGRGMGGRYFLASGVFCVLLGALFVFVETRHKNPMLPLHMLRIPTLGPVALIGLLHDFSIYGLIFVLSLTFQRLLDLNPLAAGLLFLPMTVALACGTRIGARLLRGREPFGVLTWGHIGSGAGSLILASIGVDVPYVLLTLPLLIVGFGAGLTTPAMSVSVLNSVEKTQSGLASGILNSARRSGGVMGVAVLGALLGEPVTPSGVHAAEYVAALVLCTAGFVAFSTSRSRSIKP